MHINFSFALIFLFCNLFSQNTYPIILIHGFLGWGRDEMGGYYYWGGKVDYESELRNLGYDVYTVSVGPISTNWDRAIETFYQIKGGQLDYGYNKSDELGIIQKPKGKFYEGLYPEWDHNHPIHIISHSQGGQTAKMLEMLLIQSYEGEKSPLLSNKYSGWIKSITTISTPHNGSTLVPIMLDVFPFTLSLAPWFGSIDNSSIEGLYRFDLEHWGLNKKEDEDIKSFFKRLKKSSLANTKNLCSWELSPEGSNEFNNIYKTSDDVYYFSFTTYATKKKRGSSFHKPDTKMSLHLWPSAILMGNYSEVEDSSWYLNDGIVNSISMFYPRGSKFSMYDDTPVKGIWQSMGKINLDHQSIIGHGASNKEHKDIIMLYSNHCRILYNLK